MAEGAGGSAASYIALDDFHVKEGGCAKPGNKSALGHLTVLRALCSLWWCCLGQVRATLSQALVGGAGPLETGPAGTGRKEPPLPSRHLPSKTTPRGRKQVRASEASGWGAGPRMGKSSASVWPCVPLAKLKRATRIQQGCLRSPSCLELEL